MLKLSWYTWAMFRRISSLVVLLGILISIFGFAQVASAQNYDGVLIATHEDGHDDEPEAPTVDSSCEASIPAIGWIMCPMTEFLLDSLEAIVRDGVVRSVLNFDALDGGSSQQQALESIWQGFRAIANVGFVIAFFILVYSAASGGALSAYDVKKLAPKLVFGAIFVQLSFFICIQLVYLFNAFGESVVTLMLSPLGGEGGAGSGAVFNNDLIQWNVLDTALGGAEELVSAIILILILIACVFSILGVLLMVVVFILRNMALMVLTVISPLAFVAWILPNTENLFRKWWGFYIQLLALFPIAMAFLASGRLVSYVWVNGDGGWANQWIGLIALFVPYIIAPKLFSLAGSAVGQVVRAAEGAKDGVKKSTGRVRQSNIGKRAEAGAKGRAASALNRRYGEGMADQNGGRINRAMQKAVQSGTGQRATAQWQQSREKIREEDSSAARTNVDANRSQARRAYDGKVGDEAEVAYLSDLLKEGSKATEAEQEAAVAALLNVHSTRGDAVGAVSDFVKRTDEKSKGGSHTDSDGTVHPYGDASPQERAAAGALRGRVIAANRGNLGAVPQIAKPNRKSTIDGMDAREVHGLKGGSVEHFAEDSSAAKEIARRSSDAITSGGTEGQMVRDANIQKLLDASFQNWQKSLAASQAAAQAGDTQTAQAMADQARECESVIQEVSRGFDLAQKTDAQGNMDGYEVTGRKTPNRGGGGTP